MKMDSLFHLSPTYSSIGKIPRLKLVHMAAPGQLGLWVTLDLTEFHCQDSWLDNHMGAGVQLPLAPLSHAFCSVQTI